jgi:hypothetical protein
MYKMAAHFRREHGKAPTGLALPDLQGSAIQEAEVRSIEVPTSTFLRREK